MISAAQFAHIQQSIEARDEVLFAYIHGSSVSCEHFRDIDVALFLRDASYDRLRSSKELCIGFTLPLEMTLERDVGEPIDVQLLNGTGLPFRYRVITGGRLLLDRDPDRREQFELLTRLEYFDFRPRLEEYVREALVPV